MVAHLRVLELTLVTYVEDDTLSLLFAFGSLVPQALVVVLLTLVLSRRELQRVYLLAGLTLSTGLNDLVKDSIRLPRPLGSSRSGFGMPSDHAQFMFFLSTHVALRSGGFWLLLFPVAGFVAVSR